MKEKKKVIVGNLLPDNFLEWEKSTKDSIDVKRIYIDIAGDLVSGLILSQMVYFYLPDKTGKGSKIRIHKRNNYWIAKSREDWYEEIRITPTQVDRALKNLVKLGLIEKRVMKFDGMPTIHVRLDIPIFLGALWAKLEHSDTSQLKRGDKVFLRVNDFVKQLVIGCVEEVYSDGSIEFLGDDGFRASIGPSNDEDWCELLPYTENNLVQYHEQDIIEKLHYGYDHDAYLAYLQTSIWKEKKELVHKRDGYACVDCGNTKHLDCHHLTYENLGDESLDELVTLCRSCHKLKHPDKD